MQKKIAIQLFGHMRTFEYCLKYFNQNLLSSLQQDGYEVDIFISTWDEWDHNSVNYRSSQNTEIIHLDKNTIDKINHLYKPKDLLISTQQPIEEKIIIEKLGNGKRSIKGCYNLSYSLYKSSEIRATYSKQNNINYEWVIVTRPDVLFLKPFSIDKILEFYERFKFDIPQNALFHAYNPFRSNTCNVEDPRIIAGSDLIYFAKPEIISLATNLYNNFYENIDVDDFYCFEVWQMTYYKKIGLLPLKINYISDRDYKVLYQTDLSKFLKQEKKNKMIALFNVLKPNTLSKEK